MIDIDIDMFAVRYINHIRHYLTLYTPSAKKNVSRCLLARCAIFSMHPWLREFWNCRVTDGYRWFRMVTDGYGGYGWSRWLPWLRFAILHSAIWCLFIGNCDGMIPFKLCRRFMVISFLVVHFHIYSPVPATRAWGSSDMTSHCARQAWSCSRLSTSPFCTPGMAWATRMMWFGLGSSSS